MSARKTVVPAKWTNESMFTPLVSEKTSANTRILAIAAACFVGFVGLAPYGFTQTAQQDEANTADEVTAAGENRAEEQEETETSEAVNPPMSLADRLNATQLRLLKEAQVAPKAIMLEAGTATLAFWQENMSAEQVGALVILHDQGHSPIWPETILNLHRHLPAFGWGTLSVALLPLPNATPPKRVARVPPQPFAAPDNDDPDAEKPPEGAVKDEPVDIAEADNPPIEAPATQPAATLEIDRKKTDQERQEDVMQANRQRIDAAIAFLRNADYDSIALVGMGFGGYLALEYVRQDDVAEQLSAEGGGFQAVITVDTNNHYATLQTTEKLLDQPGLPTFELATEPMLNIREMMHKRQQISRKQRYAFYRQRLLGPAEGLRYQSAETQLTKSIRGFLKTLTKDEKAPLN